MQGPVDVWNIAATKWSDTVAQVGDDDWGKATPCGEWTVQELVDHAMHWQGMGGSVLGAGTTPGQDWAEVQPAMAAALQDPANMEGIVESFGNMPKQGVLGLLIADLLVHSWDLARSIGADESIPDEAAMSTMMGLQRLPVEMLRSEQMFGPEVEVADDASATEKLIAFCGRQP